MSLSPRVKAALERAQDDARRRPPALPGPDGLRRTRRIAVGDPQAPIETFLSILDLRGLLGEDGRLALDVHLVSMGDHFDFGNRADRDRAAESGIQLLSWLAAHPEDQTTLLLGNHDLGRVGEMARFDDEAFRLAQAEADVVYRNGAPDPVLESRFLALHPDVPTAEVIARDFGAFREEQRDLVRALLKARRFRVAFAAAPDLLLCHAGVSRDDLEAIGVPARAWAFAADVADALNEALHAAVERWDAGPLSIPGLHRPGDAEHGEGRGIFYHRPSNPAHESAELFQGPPRRRFDPRRLPRGLTQAIGHIRDQKCSKLLKEWAVAPAKKDGPLRTLRTDGNRVEYRAGAPGSADADAATMVFLDGGMLHALPAEYELLDLDARTPAP